MPVMRPCLAPAGCRRLPGLVLAVALGGAGPALACELDGLSHGYGPVSALFAGLHRGTPLDGREDAPPPETPPAGRRRSGATGTAGAGRARGHEGARHAAAPLSLVAGAVENHKILG